MTLYPLGYGRAFYQRSHAFYFSGLAKFLEIEDQCRAYTAVNEALSSIENEWNAFPDGLAHREITVIMDFIRVQEYASIEELYEDLEQLFVDIYVPCKWFALNSATLTLLAIASKLPVDLTTYMPSAGDQLSKLTGTTMVSVVSQAALRSLFHKLEICEGVSDYGWSIPTIIVIQIITIVVGSLATAFRWITIVSDPPLYMKNDSDFDLEMYLDIEIFSFQYITKKRKVRMVTIIFLFYFLLKMAIVLTAFVTFCVLGAPVYMIRMIFRYCCSSFTRAVNISEKWKTELRDAFPSTEMFPEWIMRIRVEDMDKWIDLSDKSPPIHLVQLLSKPPSHPPQTLLNKLQQVGATKGYYRLSCLSLVILVKIVALAIPLALAEPILQALDEVFELIYYIDKKINVGNFEDQRKRQFAKVLLKYKNTHLSKKDSATSHRSIGEAISSIENEYQAFPIGFADREMEIIRDFILDQEYVSINELYEHLEQLFVDMLLLDPEPQLRKNHSLLQS
ncbi:hypothetical protein Syun_005825 [Stephania yunnanensis]|uniref:Uncharacterized protein n=1 Tax=Stephania yunnanensis TaxID=152371 RepID=A0AAP0KX60_9MAGN